MRAIFCGLLFLVTALFFCAASFAAQSPVRAPAESESNPAADMDSAKAAAARAVIKASAAPIAVEHEGTDSLGVRLVYLLKENFNAGTLFALTDKEQPKLQLLLTSFPEFPSRPGVGSVYSAVWIYSEGSNVLSYYLARESGLITPEALPDLADKLAARSAGIAAKHAYIFEK